MSQTTNQPTAKPPFLAGAVRRLWDQELPESVHALIREEVRKALAEQVAQGENRSSTADA